MTSLKTTARLTGLFYLGLAITGMAGFLFLRNALYDPADAAVTAANLVEKTALARLNVAVELGIVLTQALAAVWFWKLFRPVDGWAAGSIAAFGLVNSTIIMVSAVAQSAGLAAVLDPTLAPGGDGAAVAQLMFVVSTACWSAGQLFFGLWLVPMGYLAASSGWMPRALGWVLVVGGLAYILAAFVAVLWPGPGEVVVNMLTLPATVGEFWMIGYLLIFGLRAGAEQPVSTPGLP